MVALAAWSLAAPTTSADPLPATCEGNHFVASWTASPTDALAPLDALGGPVPLGLVNQTLRMIISPHLGGSQARIHLSNRFGTTPVTFGSVTAGIQSDGSTADGIVRVTFDGAPGVTIAPGRDAVSDPVSITFRAFEPLALTLYVPGPTGSPTKHWNANATSYYAPAGSGDLTEHGADQQFSSTTNSWFYVNGLDVMAPASTRSVVAFGDSITDGFVGGSPVSVPADATVADVDGRYPDNLQRRLDAAGIPISVVNSGIGSNRLLTSGEPLMLGPRGLDRFRKDALEQAGVGGILVLEGINDLGLPPVATADAMIAGYQRIIAETHAAGKKIWLATILPASNALVDGTVLAPGSEDSRQQINRWIRDQDLADGVVDFDVALRDPNNPSILLSSYSGPDNLHPNLVGYQAMADAIDLGMLDSATRTC
ncbi:GDSL-type esterase/lipase family protein [Nocardia alba]|uniref:GDSL-type esterase/lipase family protein n=1 Tax=Nocardia alba TaxID=225051 RepID=UPI001FB50F1C|nr:GDSL-type esterase/lipase family protein [Nocardia alba]